MLKRTRWTVLSLILPLGMLVACGGDGGDGGGGNGTGPDGPEGLTQQEAQEMVEALASTGAFSPTTGGSMGMSSSAAGVPVEVDVSTSNSCPGGGSVQVQGTLSGDMNQETGAGEFQLSLDQTHQDCTASSESGRSFTFNGSPSVDTDMDFTTTADGTFDVTGTNTGGFDWQSQGESGSCDVNLSYEFSGSAETFSGSVEGSICGVDVSHSVEAEVGG